jgi:hypothetical protein
MIDARTPFRRELIREKHAGEKALEKLRRMRTTEPRYCGCAEGLSVFVFVFDSISLL